MKLIPLALESIQPDKKKFIEAYVKKYVDKINAKKPAIVNYHVGDKKIMLLLKAGMDKTVGRVARTELTKILKTYFNQESFVFPTTSKLTYEANVDERYIELKDVVSTLCRYMDSHLLPIQKKIALKAALEEAGFKIAGETTKSGFTSAFQVKNFTDFYVVSYKWGTGRHHYAPVFLIDKT